MAEASETGGSRQPVTDRDAGDRRIVRDSTFVRAVADDIVPIPLGMDIELCCLQLSPNLNAMTNKGDHYTSDVDLVYAEVARIRVNFRDAVDLAMLIINQGISDKKIRGAKVAETILEWTSQAEADESGGEGDDS